jgi:hypothetical protein
MFVVLRRRLCVLVLLLASSAAAVYAQDVTEVTLKGVFLFNFARFTEWPADARTESALSACVLGDRAVGDALSKTVKGKQVAGRRITVTDVAPEESVPTCHVLYLSGIPDTRVAQIVSTLRDMPVLTVSDSEAFAKRGGIVQLFVEGGKMKFRINTRTAKRARLQLSSQLLALAEIVDEDPTVVPLAGLLIPARPMLALVRNSEHRSTDLARRFIPWHRNRP